MFWGTIVHYELRTTAQFIDVFPWAHNAANLLYYVRFVSVLVENLIGLIVKTVL
jgi:hypothetical protein